MRIRYHQLLLLLRCVERVLRETAMVFAAQALQFWSIGREKSRPYALLRRVISA